MEIKSVGDLVARDCLGEVRINHIIAVENHGSPEDGDKFVVYRLDSGRGIYMSAKDDKPINDEIAKAAAWKGDRIQPHDLKHRKTWQYKAEDGYPLWSQIGIYDGMLYWKADMTYEFLEKYDGVGLQKAYNKKLKELEEQAKICKAKSLDAEKPMERLYYCEYNGVKMYATAEFAEQRH